MFTLSKRFTIATEQAVFVELVTVRSKLRVNAPEMLSIGDPAVIA